MNFENMRQNPKPMQDPLPVWVGGNIAASIKRAAERGTGWHPINLGLEQFGEGVTAYQAACQAAGKLAGPVCLRTMPRSRVRPEGERFPFTGSPEEVAADIDAYAAAGLSQILFSPTVTSMEEIREAMRIIAEEVRPLVSL